MDETSATPPEAPSNAAAAGPVPAPAEPRPAGDAIAADDTEGQRTAVPVEAEPAGDASSTDVSGDVSTDVSGDASTDADSDESGGDGEADGDGIGDPSVRTTPKKRRRGSRGGKGRKKPVGADGFEDDDDDDDEADSDADGGDLVGTELDATERAGQEASATPRPARAPRAPRAPRPPKQPVDAIEGDSDELSDVVTAEPPVEAAPKPPRQRAPRVTAVDGEPAEPTEVVTDDAAVESAPKPARQRTPREPKPELPERISEGRPSAEAAEKALVRKPQIGDTRPAPGSAAAPAAPAAIADAQVKPETGEGAKKRRRGGKGRKPAGEREGRAEPSEPRSGRSSQAASQVDPDVLEKRKGRERNGRPIGRYMMAVQVRPTLTQVAVLEGRNLIEHYVSRPADDVSQIHGNIYLGKVQNVLPGMEAAFVDISTPKNAVLYRGDVQYDAEDIVEKGANLRIEQMLKAKQLIISQVTKNPIGAKGARLTQEVSLPGRFVVLIPNSKTYGISKRLPDDVRKRLRNILDRVKPAEHGLIVRTAAENATEHELRADMTRLLDQWNAIEAKAKRSNTPSLLYREPELAVRVIREEFNAEYRGVIIDDLRLFEDVRDYVTAFNPELADRIEYYDSDAEGLPLYERHHIHEQLHKALDRKVWLPSGGSLIIEHTEALTVIDVNTGKNVGTTNLEETVFRNNLEAADEVAKQLRLRDIGGIVVIDFIDMEIRDNRKKVVDAFRDALARDKTRTQVFDITELGLVEMTRKRIGEGLLTNFADQCPNCDGRGVVIDAALLE